jgi:hypothetical protein
MLFSVAVRHAQVEEEDATDFRPIQTSERAEQKPGDYLIKLHFFIPGN